MSSVLTNNRFHLISEFAKTDNKKRISLGAALAEATSKAFNIYRNETGQIILDPVKAVPEPEAWLFKNKKALSAVLTGIKESAKGETHDLGSFAKFAE